MVQRTLLSFNEEIRGKKPLNIVRLATLFKAMTVDKHVPNSYESVWKDIHRLLQRRPFWPIVLESQRITEAYIP